MTRDWIWQQPDWPAFHWQAARLAPLLRDINQLQGRLLGATGTVVGVESLQAEMDALLDNAINTAAIEGEALSVDAVRSSLARRLGMDRAGLPPATPQADGMVALLLDATRNHTRPLTLERLYAWHRDLFPDPSARLRSVRVGELRGDEPMQVVSGPVGRQTVHFQAPPRAGLEVALQEFLDWFERSRGDAAGEPLLRAGLAHLWFVTLHPFEDGNGRLARAITDLALAQAEQQSVRFYAMAATIMQQRKAYYAVLENTQRGDLDITAWLEWFLIQLRQTLLEALQRIETVVQKARFWQQHARSALSERQIKVLNRLLDAGPEGFVGGLNARKYMSLTAVSKATATRDLAELVAKGCLVQAAGGGRSTHYAVNWDGV